ncbi:UDP-N-acetylmuramoyl-tripeptide--D-alanyl-D-alanine ligase [Arachidicoccus terrestris]|uniref:UDP-N-acetylmuramoyl-tripeptide--D-alanyl-D- alanine ligase n=1 Tax=Arachidicoccus terrestris TaxID=2875539 RepID=UPI001CC6ED76|nr:UDP-N-acetylmuramoyl-tripeptide--D-alanyl-D-alanine ligase [Arachidicoccus terrestris]UAY56312.1 UDP-N-acetylmuramoyl-tripeptide--D-alanyl-D-alanine ligase [Arachidicoccus terrestris]
MSIAELYELYTRYPSIQTDSRKIQKGDLFFALKGPNFNGNLYAEQAIRDGAAYAIVDEAVASDNVRLIQVKDVLSSLQQLAHYHRKTFDIPFIAITGSNGKTTTKELVHAVLSTQYTTYTTKGNLNNHIGVPLTLLSIKRDADVAVIEMGANHLGEIAGYCVYTEPTIGIITNCGKAHLEGFGSEQGVRKGKGELFDFLRAHNGTSFAYADYPYFENMTRGIAHQFWYSENANSTKENLIAAGDIYKSDPFLEIRLQAAHRADRVIETQLVGAYNLPNVLCAVALGRYFDIPDDTIQKAIAAYAPSNSRSQLIHKDSNQIILDAYNANPSSMQAAILNFSKMKADNKVLILGGMKELGQESPAEHLKLKALIDQSGSWDKVILIGPEFEGIAPEYSWFKDQHAAAEALENTPFRNSYILVKGSRSNGLEKLVEVL